MRSNRSSTDTCGRGEIPDPAATASNVLDAFGGRARDIFIFIKHENEEQGASVARAALNLQPTAVQQRNYSNDDRDDNDCTTASASCISTMMTMTMTMAMPMTNVPSQMLITF